MDILKKYYQELLIGFLFILILGLYGIYFYEKFYKKDSFQIIETNFSEIIPEEEKSNEISSEMYVEIKGQVVNPGVYAVTSHNIINDVIDMAGGLKTGAYTRNINLSKKVSDEMVIIVYSTYEYSVLSKPNIVYIEKPCQCKDEDISSCIENGSSVIEKGPNTSLEDKNDKEKSLININTATEEELESLNGIGESKANAIIKYRNENGNFKSIEEITNVTGISQNIFEKIKDSITV